MKAIWFVFLGIYLLTLVPAGFTLFAAFVQREADPSGDAWRAVVILGVYLIGFPLLLLLTKSWRSSACAEPAE